MKKLLIIGASGHGKVIADIAYRCGRWEEISFLDDDEEKIGNFLLGFKILDVISNLKWYIKEYEFIVGIGDARIREKISRYLDGYGATITTIIHPSAVVGLDVEIGRGTVVMPMAVINASSTIDEGCIINTGASVDHDCALGPFVHLSPGVTLSGNVKIESRTWLGTGAKTINGIFIGKDCVIGAGAVVTKNINEPGIYTGIPAKFSNSLLMLNY